MHSIIATGKKEMKIRPAENILSFNTEGPDIIEQIKEESCMIENIEYLRDGRLQKLLSATCAGLVGFFVLKTFLERSYR
jgi:fatty acid/phospholipid biosynthesis enzyme